MSLPVLSPRITEKSIAQSEHGAYVFDVPVATNKIEVTKAVEAAFKVDVVSVNIVIAKGKLKRYKNKMGRRANTKKAIVRLKAGQTIALFEGGK